ncbi:leucyl aminopeptidase [Candidatus Micrarchaeota archaeon]|nr:leucyl aminopeptidase [Candidatus Micrarchaeota archaeon]
MKLQVNAGRIEDTSAEAILLFHFKDETLGGLSKHVDEKLKGQIGAVLKNREFIGKAGQLYLVSINLEKIGIKRVILAGMGGRNEFTLDKLRGAASKGANYAKNLGLKHLAILHPLEAPVAIEETAAALTEGVMLGTYQYNKYHTEERSEIKTLDSVSIYTDVNKVKNIQKAVEFAETVCNATNLTRDLNNEPGNVGTPTYMAKMAEEAGKKHGFKVKVFGKNEIEGMKMHSFLSVAKGSVQEPKFVVMEYNGGGKDAIVLVGKGITFDSGGISIKPSRDMEKMKWDKSGACSVIGAMSAAAALKLPLHLIGLTPFTENLPSGSASKPGDVVYASNGTSIEIQNTDAEGRLVLADALVYAQKYKPKAVIDLATLTGACVVALGDVAAGLMGNDEKLIEKIRKASEKSGDKCWHLPLWKEYDEKIKSDIADIKNVGTPGGDAGAITAAMFLKRFVNYPWVHLDIAGTAWNDYEKPYLTKGATGFGVRLLIEMLRD